MGTATAVNDMYVLHSDTPSQCHKVAGVNELLNVVNVVDSWYDS